MPGKEDRVTEALSGLGCPTQNSSYRRRHHPTHTAGCRVGPWFSHHAFPAHLCLSHDCTTVRLSLQGRGSHSPQMWAYGSILRSLGPDQPNSALLWASQDNLNLEDLESYMFPNPLALKPGENGVAQSHSSVESKEQNKRRNKEASGQRKVRPLNIENKRTVSGGDG